MRIVCFGDSNTYGYDPRGFFGDRYEAEDRWTDLLVKKTGHEVINLGANGREIPHSGAALPKLGAEDLLLVMLGTNDLLQGASAEAAVARMEGFLRQIVPDCRRILLVSPPPLKRGAWVNTDALVSESIRLAQAYGVLSRKLKISFVDTGNWNIELAFDGVHFTEAGHHTFAEKLALQI